MQRVQYKHGDTPLVQTTRVPDAHCLAAWCPLFAARAESISQLAMYGCVTFSI